MKITGTIQESGVIKLRTFNGLKTETLECEIVDNFFEFNSNEGIGHLVKDDRLFLIFLEDCNITLDLNIIENTIINSGELNKKFEVYSKEYQIINQSLSALYYLRTISPTDEIEKLIIEKQAQIVKGDDFYSSYCWLKHLVSSVFSVTSNTDAVNQLITYFRQIDFSSPELQKTDLLPELIEGQMVLIENSGKETIEDMFDEQNRSVDALLNNGYTFDVLEYWFDTLEKRSLYPSAKYLALKVLAEIEVLPKTLRYKLEGYRGSAKANEAFNFKVSDGRMLHDIEGKKLLLFSDSKCSPCTDILPQVVSAVADKDIRLIIISDVVKDLLTLHTTDETLFDSYFVFATPTMIIVDEENKLYLKPNGIEHLKAYLEQLN